MTNTERREHLYEQFNRPRKTITLQPESLFLGVCLGVIIATCLILLVV